MVATGWPRGDAVVATVVATGWPRGGHGGTGAGSMGEPALFVGSARLGVSRGISRGRGGHREHHIRGMQAKRVA